MAKQKKSRPISSADLEEEIEVKPSTELTSDEYIRVGNDKILACLFYSPYNDDVEILSDLLTKLGYIVETHTLDKIHHPDTRSKILTQIVNKAKGKDGLILLVAKAFLTDEQLPQIWSMFTSVNCQALKNKPKIFIFQVTSQTGKDSAVRKKYSIAYTNEFEVPSEADMMIVYEKLPSAESSNLITNLTEQIKENGAKEDITTLVTYSEDSDDDSDGEEEENKNEAKKEDKSKETPAERHLLISTLTRKFYFLPAKLRGYHHVITKSHQNIEETINDLKETVKLHHGRTSESKNGGTSFTQKLKKSFSFRNKDSPNVSPKADKSKQKHDKVMTDKQENHNNENRAKSSGKLEKVLGKTKSENKLEKVNEGVGTSKESSNCSTANSTPKPTRNRTISSSGNNQQGRIRKGSVIAMTTSQESIKKKPHWIP